MFDWVEYHANIMTKANLFEQELLYPSHYQQILSARPNATEVIVVKLLTNPQYFSK